MLGFPSGCIGLFADIGLYDRQPGPDGRLPKPGCVQRWMNVYDVTDVLSFLTEPFFSGVKDYKFDNAAGALEAHSAYFQRPSFYKSGCAPGSASHDPSISIARKNQGVEGARGRRRPVSLRQGRDRRRTGFEAADQRRAERHRVRAQAAHDLAAGA